MVGVSRGDRQARRAAMAENKNIENKNEANKSQVSFREVNWGRLFGYLKPYGWQMALAIVALIISTSFGLLFPLVIVQLLNSVTQTGQASSLNLMAGMLLGI